MGTDKVLLEVLNNRFTGIVEEMGYIIHRASFTVFVKETWDFDSALVTPDGEIFCYPRNIGVTNMLGMHMGDAIRSIPHYEPGDVVVTNDPHRTRGMCTHLPDIMMFKPIFHEGRGVCFAWCFIHSSDVGGLVPGSISPTAYDRFQEGIAIPPTKLFRAGVLNQELLDLILANVRIPDQNWGDMKALIAALTICERRMGDLLRQYGEETVRRVIRDLLDYGERRARQIFSEVPDGEYDFSDYLEGDLFSRYHVRIKVRVTVRGSEVHLDFTGTDPQLRAALNMPTYGKPNQWLVLGIVNYLRTSDRTLPLNRGILRPVGVTVPQGTVLNPLPFAASYSPRATPARATRKRAAASPPGTSATRFQNRSSPSRTSDSFGASGRGNFFLLAALRRSSEKADVPSPASPAATVRSPRETASQAGWRTRSASRNLSAAGSSEGARIPATKARK